MLSEGLDRLSGVRPQLWSGIFEFEHPRDGLTPGQIRETLRGSSAIEKSEHHMIQVLGISLVISLFMSLVLKERTAYDSGASSIVWGVFVKCLRSKRKEKLPRLLYWYY